MAMEISKVLEALEAIENGADLIEGVKAELAKKSREAKNLRTRAESAESKAKKFAETFEVDLEDESLEARIGELKSKIKSAGSPGGSGSNADVLELKSQLKTLTEELNREKGARQQEREKGRAAMVRDRLTKELIKHKVHEDLIDEVVGSLTNRVKVNDDDSLAWLDGDDEVTVDLGVKKYVEKKPILVKNTQNPGGGTGGGGQQGGPGKAPQIVSPEQAKDVAWYRANAEKIASGEIVIQHGQPPGA